MAFNPDEYLKKASSDKASGFNPDAYLAKAKAPEKEGDGQAALESFGNAATLGYLPHLQAAASKAVPNPSSEVDADLASKGFKITQSSYPGYVQTRDANIKRQDQQKKDFPWSTAAGTAAGLLGGGLMIPVGAPAKLAGGMVGPVTRGADLANKVWQGAKAGGIMGAAMNPGDVEGDVTLMPAERAKNAALGFGLGGGLPIAASLLGRGKEAAIGILGKKAEEKAFRSLGRGTPQAMQKMVSSGENRAIGRELLDEGAIPVLGTPGRIAGRVEGLREKAGEQVGSLVKSAGGAKLVDAENLGLQILDSPELALMRKTPGMEGAVTKIEQQVETLAKNGKMNLEEAQALRQQIDKSIKWGKVTPDVGAAEGLHMQRTGIRDAMNEGINSLNPGGPKDQLLAANRKYGHLATAGHTLEKELARDQSNRAISLTDTIAAVGGAASGNTPEERTRNAILLGLLNKGGRSFGNAVQARGYNALAGALAKSPKIVELAQSNPGIVSRLAASLGQTVTGGKQDYSLEKDPILNDPEILMLFKKDESLLNNVQDTHRRALIRDAMKRLPASR